MDFKDYKIGVYLRTAQKDDEAIERQKEFNISYCKYRGYPEVVKIYTDNGYSGRTENRPAYKRMIKDIRNGKINVIVVSNIDRLTRQPIFFYHKIIDYILKKKLIVISAVESPLSDEQLFNMRFRLFLIEKQQEILNDGGVE
mgnify:CR=1 FL=1